MRQLEEENNGLKKLVADRSLDKQMLQEVIKKALKVQFAKSWPYGYKINSVYLPGEPVVW